MKKIVAVGEIVVEIMATEPGDGFREPLSLIGPYPSGAPAIFIDQVARLGQPCGLISCVGPDDFGHLNMERLRADGADVSAVTVAPEGVTGSAFVRYRSDGERDFVFNIKHSACGRITRSTEGDRLLDSADHLHVMGSSLFSESIVALIRHAMDRVKARGGTVSFDPNVRKEMLTLSGMRAALETILGESDVFLPSGPELFLLSTATEEEDAIAEILDLGVTAVVLKRGADGASYYDGESTVHHPAFAVTEVDPTGAGDCFGATFVTAWLRGLAPARALRLAAAAGALAVTRKGPMEGTSTEHDIETFAARRHVAVTTSGMVSGTARGDTA
ncbi:tagatose kinase [Roseospira visakhapatnamensis]|uniref:Sugar/nucleoside kinase (Ribokinase family) n=1 Tax=Roseospira visakhapatnamensis TaxID=390880 RepID=A0A7W6RDL9_9PROT|nr:sugar kinase [Roseospira visakhapatnamensis]MBB4266382.1 sugar/nucleoside kinase (ribokinase family) [Roseospira visakhapatnamensis]